MLGGRSQRFLAAFAVVFWGAPAAAGVTRAVLDNGLRGVIVPSSIAPVAATEMNYLVGGDEAPPGFPGTAHAQEHMMFRGSPGLFAAPLANITAAPGGDFDADTLALTRLDPNYYPLALGDEVLAGGFYASRLFRDLGEKTGLVYSVGIELNAGRARSTYAVEYACDPANVTKARAIVVRDLREMQKVPLATQELERTRALLIRQIWLAQSSFSQIAQGLLERSLDGLPLDEPHRAAERYLKMTAPEVRAAFATSRAHLSGQGVISRSRCVQLSPPRWSRATSQTVASPPVKAGGVSGAV
jgi:predicted Zn-dependent peptidase